MQNDTDWSRRQTRWPLSFRRLPDQSLRQQCGKMQTSSAENAIKLSIRFLTNDHERNLEYLANVYCMLYS